MGQMQSSGGMDGSKGRQLAKRLRGRDLLDEDTRIPIRGEQRYPGLGGQRGEQPLERQRQGGAHAERGVGQQHDLWGIRGSLGDGEQHASTRLGGRSEGERRWRGDAQAREGRVVRNGLAVHHDGPRLPHDPSALGDDGNAIPCSAVRDGDWFQPFQVEPADLSRLDRIDRDPQPPLPVPFDERRIPALARDGLVDLRCSGSIDECSRHRALCHPERGARDRRSGRDRQSDHRFLDGGTVVSDLQAQPGLGRDPRALPPVHPWCTSRPTRPVP